jgi:predicted DNA-binding transcriptional regulator YafY
VRAGRLITLLLLLERRGRLTADQLARELEVSARTVLRDIESLSAAGVRIVGSPGVGGGFELHDTGAMGLVGVGASLGADTRGRRRARVRVTAEGRRMAALLGQPVLHVRRAAPVDGWSDATFRFDTSDGALSAVLALGPHVCVVSPEALRHLVVERIGEMAELYT